MKQLKAIYLLMILTVLIQSCNKQNREKIIVDKKQDTTDTIFTLLTYGFMDRERQKANDIIAKTWGIRFYAVAGCLVTKDLIDSVKTNNDHVNKLIEKKYGANWQEKFEKEVNDEFKRGQKVTKILDKADIVKKKNDELGLKKDKLYYNMSPFENSGVYNVSVEGWGKIDNQDTKFSYYRMTVNYKTKQCELVSDKMEPSK